jgi:hypothetical protein
MLPNGKGWSQPGGEEFWLYGLSSDFVFTLNDGDTVAWWDDMLDAGIEDATLFKIPIVDRTLDSLGGSAWFAANISGISDVVVSAGTVTQLLMMKGGPDSEVLWQQVLAEVSMDDIDVALGDSLNVTWPDNGEGIVDGGYAILFEPGWGVFVPTVEVV